MVGSQAALRPQNAQLIQVHCAEMFVSDFQRLVEQGSRGLVETLSFAWSKTASTIRCSEHTDYLRVFVSLVSRLTTSGGALCFLADGYILD